MGYSRRRIESSWEPLPKKALDEADLVGEKQTEPEAEHARRGPEMAVHELKTSRIGNRHRDRGRDHIMPAIVPTPKSDRYAIAQTGS